MNDWIKEHRKAIVSGITAGLVALIAAFPDGITAEEWAAIAAAVLFPFGITWAVPNKPPAEPVEA